MNFENVVRYGYFYYPAHKHYGKFVSVRCDRCNKTDLTSCIGYDKMDLCLPCADSVVATRENKQPIDWFTPTPALPVVMPPYNPPYNPPNNPPFYSPPNGPVTKMMQNMFTK